MVHDDNDAMALMDVSAVRKSMVFSVDTKRLLYHCCLIPSHAFTVVKGTNMFLCLSFCSPLPKAAPVLGF